MDKLTLESIPYGVSKFDELREDGRYYIDKTPYIRLLEQRADFLLFVRPRRFGKSLFIDMLRCYYDSNMKDRFQQLFGELDIGKNPTKGANAYWVLSLNFSRLGKKPEETIAAAFERYMRAQLAAFVRQHEEAFRPEFLVGLDEKDPRTIFDGIEEARKGPKGRPLYLMIDEYDNFTNELVAGDGRTEYLEITHKTGFYRGWFKIFKDTCSRIFMTGVSPVTMDDLTSGFNIATNISQEDDFNAMIGFDETECVELYSDFKGIGRFTADDPRAIVHFIKPFYDGYCFSLGKMGQETVFNSDMALYYLKTLLATGAPPKNIVDSNIRSDWAKLQMILDAQKNAQETNGTLPLTQELAENEAVTFDLVESFPIENLLEEENYKSLYYYYGIVTMSHFDCGMVYYKLPNECVRRQVFEYMRKKYEQTGQSIVNSEFQSAFKLFAWNGVFKPLFEYLAGKFKTNSVIRDGLNGEPLVNGFMRAYLTMHDGYMVAPELELNGRHCDYAFFPNRSLLCGLQPQHSYVIELKHSKKAATGAEIAAKHAGALTQLKAYSEHPQLAALAGGSPVHFLDVEFVGRTMVRCEEVCFTNE